MDKKTVENLTPESNMQFFEKAVTAFENLFEKAKMKNELHYALALGV